MSLVASSCEASTMTGVSWYFPQSLDHGGQVQVSERKSEIQLPASSVDSSLVPSTQWQFQVWPQLLQTLMALSSLEESVQVRVSESSSHLLWNLVEFCLAAHGCRWQRQRFATTQQQFQVLLQVANTMLV